MYVLNLVALFLFISDVTDTLLCGPFLKYVLVFYYDIRKLCLTFVTLFLYCNMSNMKVSWVELGLYGKIKDQLEGVTLSKVGTCVYVCVHC